MSLQRILWRLGGFDITILAEDRCRTIRPKYSSMGSLVLITAMLACCSGTYALWTIFKSLWIAGLAGAIWGTLIFHLDRYLLSSTRKLATIKEYITGKHVSPPYRSTSPWTQLAVRIILAVVIGLIVSKPIEVRILQPWINEYERKLDRDRAESADHNSELQTLRRQDSEIVEQLNQKEAELANWRKILLDESLGSGGSMRPGQGPQYDLDRELAEEAKEAADRITVQRDDIRRKIDRLRTELYKGVNEDNAARGKERSIISDLRVIGALSTEGSDQSLVQSVSWTLTLLFVLIEAIPVLAKSFSPFDPYDAALLDLEYNAILDSLASARRKHKKTMDDELDWNIGYTK